jgi:hypothetical protein
MELDEWLEIIRILGERWQEEIQSIT